jgi:hypothetical protein
MHPVPQHSSPELHACPSAQQVSLAAIALPLQHWSVVPSRQPAPHGFLQGHVTVSVQLQLPQDWPLEAVSVHVGEQPLQAQLTCAVKVIWPSHNEPQLAVVLPGQATETDDGHCCARAGSAPTTANAPSSTAMRRMPR